MLKAGVTFVSPDPFDALDAHFVYEALDEFFGQAPSPVMSHELIRLECVTAEHNKFYELWIDDNGIVIARWGRIGSTGQMQKFVSVDPKQFVGDRVNEKLAKGYTRVS